MTKSNKAVRFVGGKLIAVPRAGDVQPKKAVTPSGSHFAKLHATDHRRSASPGRHGSASIHASFNIRGDIRGNRGWYIPPK